MARSMSSRSPNEGTRPLPQRVLVGRVRRPHGVAGELLVENLSDSPGRFEPGSELWLVTAAGDARRVTIAASRPHARGLLLRLDGITDREAALALRGAGLEADRSTSPPAPPGSYYYFELAGCRCRDARQGDLGVVSELIEDGGGLLLEISDGRRRLLVPFVRDYVESVDVAAGSIRLRLPAGLLETCASTS